MKKHQWLNERTISIALAVVVVFGVLCARMLWHGTPQHPQTATIYHATNSKQLRNPRAVINHHRPVSVLLMVTTKNQNLEHRQGRVKTVMLITANPRTRQLTVTSLPVETEIRLPGYGKHSYAAIEDVCRLAGPAEMINALQNYLKVPIDYYLMVTPSAVDRAIKQVNQVEVTLPATFTSRGAHFVQGQTVELDAHQVRAFTAPVKNDPQGISGSRDRERLVLISLLRHASTYRRLVNRPFVASIHGRAISNAHFTALLQIANNYRSASQNVTSNNLRSGDLAERQRVADIARDNLKLPRKPLTDQHPVNNLVSTWQR